MGSTGLHERPCTTWGVGFVLVTIDPLLTAEKVGGGSGREPQPSVKLYRRRFMKNRETGFVHDTHDRLYPK